MDIVGVCADAHVRADEYMVAYRDEGVVEDGDAEIVSGFYLQLNEWTCFRFM